MTQQPSKNPQNIDVICEIKADGSMIPIKMRFTDDDGLMQEYKIKGFRIPTLEVSLGKNIIPYECQIESFGQLMTVSIFYNVNEHVWKIRR